MIIVRLDLIAILTVLPGRPAGRSAAVCALSSTPTNHPNFDNHNPGQMFRAGDLTFDLAKPAACWQKSLPIAGRRHGQRRRANADSLYQ
jgi:hypothetical protein